MMGQQGVALLEEVQDRRRRGGGRGRRGWFSVAGLLTCVWVGAPLCAWCVGITSSVFDSGYPIPAYFIFFVGEKGERCFVSFRGAIVMHVMNDIW